MGGAVPVKFTLGGNQGLAILAAGYPKSLQIGCDATSPSDQIEETSAAGSSGLTYDSATGLYSYVWKTDKAWARTCRVLMVRLVDGTEHTACSTSRNEHGEGPLRAGAALRGAP